jgi:hypothetical protein
MLDATLELLTSDAISSEQMRESAMALVYLEPKILAEIDRIGRSYDEPKTREVRVALLLGIALRAMGLLAWNGKNFHICAAHIQILDRLLWSPVAILPVTGRIPFSHQGVPRPLYRGYVGPDWSLAGFDQSTKGSLCATPPSP